MNEKHEPAVRIPADMMPFAKDAETPAKPVAASVYTVGNARLWIGDDSFEPGAAMTAIDRIEAGLLEYYIRCGHLILNKEGRE